MAVYSVYLYTECEHDNHVNGIECAEHGKATFAGALSEAQFWSEGTDLDFFEVENMRAGEDGPPMTLRSHGLRVWIARRGCELYLIEKTATDMQELLNNE